MNVFLEGYNSHIAVLEQLEAEGVPMKRVLEFGAGQYSTAWFLERAERLHTVESDPDWYAWAVKTYKKRKGFELSKVRPPDLRRYDLVFIDDGSSAAERLHTLGWVLNRPHPVVVLHDSNVPEYRAVLEALELETETFKDDWPWTEVIR